MHTTTVDDFIVDSMLEMLEMLSLSHSIDCVWGILYWRISESHWSPPLPFVVPRSHVNIQFRDNTHSLVQFILNKKSTSCFTRINHIRDSTLCASWAEHVLSQADFIRHRRWTMKSMIRDAIIYRTDRQKPLGAQGVARGTTIIWFHGMRVWFDGDVEWTNFWHYISCHRHRLWSVYTPTCSASPTVTVTILYGRVLCAMSWWFRVLFFFPRLLHEWDWFGCCQSVCIRSGGTCEWQWCGARKQNSSASIEASAIDNNSVYSIVYPLSKGLCLCV